MVREQGIVEFVRAHAGTPFWYLIPRAQYWNDQNIVELRQVLSWMDQLRVARIRDLPGFQVPLGDTVDPEGLVVREWDADLQERIMDMMIDAGIIKPTTQGQSRNDRLANVRNYFNLIRKLGLGHKNAQGKLFITDMGKAFMSAPTHELGSIIETQLARLQFVNPSIAGDVYSEFKLYPYLFVLQLIGMLPDQVLTTEEFSLFVAYSKAQSEVDRIAELVVDYRSLLREDQRRVLDLAAQGYPEKANARVHLGLFGVTPTLHYEANQLSVVDDKRRAFVIHKYLSALRYVEYERFEDWFSYMGSEESRISLRDVLMYYAEAASERRAKELIKGLQLETLQEDEDTSLEDLLAQLFSERVLEDALEKRPGLIEAGLILVENGRQYRTDVGPIDLLCQDAQGRFVVVELKKGQAEDKVVGQTLRYMGWVKQYLSTSRRVRGIIVARDFTEKIRMALVGMQHSQPIIDLKEFAFSATAEIREVSGLTAGDAN